MNGGIAQLVEHHNGSNNSLIFEPIVKPITM